jgi:hypothetical protein
MPSARRVVVAAVLAFASLAAGCGARGDLAALNVKSAALENFQLQTAAAVLGVVVGEADLVVTDTGDDKHAFPVTLGGPTFGVVLDVSAADEDLFGLDGFGAALDLSGAGKDPSGAVLLGVYGGERAGFHLGVGITQHSLENQSGVKLDAAVLGAGFGFFAGPEWLTLDLDTDDSDDTPADDPAEG